MKVSYFFAAIIFILGTGSSASEYPVVDPYISVLFKANIQDTLKQEQKSVFRGTFRTYTGAYFVTGIDQQNNYGVFAIKEKLEEIKEPLDWQVTIGTQDQVILKDMATSKEVTLEVEMRLDDRGSLESFVISPPEIKEMISFKLLNILTGQAIRDYGFSTDSVARRYIPDSYRCYVRRKLLRCFSDVNMVMSVQVRQ